MMLMAAYDIPPGLLRSVRSCTDPIPTQRSTPMAEQQPTVGDVRWFQKTRDRQHAADVAPSPELVDQWTEVYTGEGWVKTSTLIAELRRRDAAIAAVRELIEAADHRVREAIPASGAEHTIAEGVHTVRVGNLRAALALAAHEQAAEATP